MISSASASSPGRRPDYVALAGALLTASAHLLTRSAGANPYFIVGACVFWIGFVIARTRADRSVLRDWGFRSDNLREASLVPLLFFAGSALALAAYALSQGQFRFPAHTLLLLLLYPLWGTIQQFLVLGIVVGNLEKLALFAARKPWLVAVGALIFGGIHLPNLMLTAGTTLLALLYVPLFLRYRNIWPLGVVHGWLGSLFYLWALNEDPWLRTFG